MNLVSIVVPMYNEQKNIESCINVLKSQINQNFDVVFVNDGSSDMTVEKLKYYLNLGVQFSYKIIEQPNKGAAVARKIGMDHTLTKFIMIFDCDDKLSNNVIEEIYTIDRGNPDVDIIIPNMQVQAKNEKWNKLIFYTESSVLEPLDCIKNSLDGWSVHGCFAIKKTIFDKSYKDYKLYNINNENYINNDEVITRLNFLNSKKIIRSNADYYYYYNSLSTTKKINQKKYLMIHNALILNCIFSTYKQINSSVKAELISVLWGSFWYMNKNKLNLENLVDWNKSIRESLNEINYFNIISELKLKQKIQLTFLKIIHLL